MAALADDWEESRQTCIDVLCAYGVEPAHTALSAADADVHPEGADA